MSKKKIKYVNKKKKKSGKRTISAQFYWLLLFIASVITVIVFFNQPVFPKKWAFLILAFVVGILLITGIFTSIFSPRNRFQKFVNATLAFILGFVSIITPYYINRITALFDSALGNKVKINLYVMSDEYKSARPDVFIYTIDLPETNSNGEFINVDMSLYGNAVYGTALSTDKVNQQYALDQLNDLYGYDVQTIDKDTLGEAVQQLYENHTDIMIMSEAMASSIEDIEGYENFSIDTKILYTYEREIDSSAANSVDVNMTSKPFTIFFGGNDQTGSLSLEGRTDVDMSVTVNPNTHQIIIVNLPRDSYINNPYYNEKDKLTHLGLVGITNTLEGLGDIYGTEISNYILVNFDTYTQIINALGGVTVDNPYEFTAIDGEYFQQGEIELSGEAALMYVRERYSLPDGDFGRNMHQQLVMKAIINKLCSSAIVTKGNSLIDSLDGMFLTNVSSKSLYSLMNKQLDEGIEWNMVNYHIGGETGMEICASAPGQYLSVVYPYDNQIEFVRNEIQKVINGEEITQQDLPEGTFYNTESEE